MPIVEGAEARWEGDSDSEASDDTVNHHGVEEVDRPSVSSVIVDNARLHMEQHARYLLRQIEAVETAKRGQRPRPTTTTREDDDSNVQDAAETKTLFTDMRGGVVCLPDDESAKVYDSAAAPTVDTWSTDSSSDEDLHTPKNQGPSLADQLSTCKSTNTVDDDDAARCRIHDLERENARLKESLQQCANAAQSIHQNADLKIVRLQMEVTHLRQQLSDELAVNAKNQVLNASFRKQIQQQLLADQQQSHCSTSSSSSPTSPVKYDLQEMHDRELTVEKHLNSLIVSRNLALKESSALKKLLLGTCYECRQRLPLRRKTAAEAAASSNRSSGGVATTEAAASETQPRPQHRPTYQSSARHVLKNLPTDGPMTMDRNKPTLGGRTAAKGKGCLKSTTVDTIVIPDQSKAPNQSSNTTTVGARSPQSPTSTTDVITPEATSKLPSVPLGQSSKPEHQLRGSTTAAGNPRRHTEKGKTRSWMGGGGGGRHPKQEAKRRSGEENNRTAKQKTVIATGAVMMKQPMHKQHVSSSASVDGRSQSGSVVTQSTTASSQKGRAGIKKHSTASSSQSAVVNKSPKWKRRLFLPNQATTS